MKNILTSLFGILAAFSLLPVQAEEAPTKVTGVMCCAKCTLKTASACADVLQVGTTTYLLEEAGKRKTSGHVCSGTANKTVSGKVEERDGQKVLVVSAITDSAAAAAPAPATTSTPATTADTKLEGELSCEKCTLGTATACADALKVGDILYHLEQGGNRKTSAHECDGTAHAVVTGKVEERNGEKFVVVTSITKS